MKSVLIYGKEIPFKIVCELPVENAVGCYKDGVIYIDKTLKGKELKVTLLHECLHALLERMCITHDHLNEEVEEIIVDSIATWLNECNRFELRLKKK